MYFYIQNRMPVLGLPSAPKLSLDSDGMGCITISDPAGGGGGKMANLAEYWPDDDSRAVAKSTTSISSAGQQWIWSALGEPK
jgi:hypothetical protein